MVIGKNLALLALAVNWAAMEGAQAAGITYYFEGDITSSGVPGVTASDTIFGSFTYDTDATLFNTSTACKVYLGGAISFSIATGSGSFTGTRSALEPVVCNDNGGLGDSFGITNNTTAGDTASGSIGSYDLSTAAINLTDTSGSVFSDRSLPTSIDLNDFDANKRTGVLFYVSGSTAIINYNIAALSLAPLNAVPVPAAAWLFGAALGLLGWLRRRTA